MVEWPLCAEMVVIHKAVGAQQFAAQLIGRGLLRGGVLDIVSHRISRCIPISFFIQIVGTIRAPQDSEKSSISFSASSAEKVHGLFCSSFITLIICASSVVKKAASS